MKGGRTVSIRDLRALHGVLENVEALLAGLIVLRKTSHHAGKQPFDRFAAKRARWIWAMSTHGSRVLSLADIMDGRKFAKPLMVGRHEACSRCYRGFRAARNTLV